MAGIRSDQDFAHTIRALRQQVADTLAAIDELERRFVSSHDDPDEPSMQDPASHGEPPVRTDVIIHNVISPSMARSAQQHLAGQAGVTRATVRELAEGTLRITAESQDGISSSVLAAWEPSRHRVITTETGRVLEIELARAT